MTSFGNIQRCLANTAGKPCLALNVIYLIVRHVVSLFFNIDIFSRMNSSLQFINISSFYLPYSYYERELNLRRPFFNVNYDAFERFNLFLVSVTHFPSSS